MKKILFSLAFVAGVIAANADILYWMVDDAHAVGATEASLYAVYSGSDTSITSPTGPIETQDAAAIANAYNAYGQFETPLGSYAGSGWSYFIEVVNGAQTYTSSAMDYATAKSMGYIQTSALSPVSLANGSFGQAQTYNVPEPTSGLLFVIGGMLLGLKRKRQV